MRSDGLVSRAVEAPILATSKLPTLESEVTMAGEVGFLNAGDINVMILQKFEKFDFSRAKTRYVELEDAEPRGCGRGRRVWRGLSEMLSDCGEMRLDRRDRDRVRRSCRLGDVGRCGWTGGSRGREPAIDLNAVEVVSDIASDGADVIFRGTRERVIINKLHRVIYDEGTAVKGILLD